MDLSVNKAVKEFLRKKLQQWYSGKVEKSRLQEWEIYS